MKSLSSMTTGLAGLAVTALMLALPANAQTHRAHIDIPFQFTAGNEVLPAGQYEVVLDEFAHILLRNSAETKIHIFALTANYEKRASANLSPATLRFHQYAGSLFLTAAWAPGHEHGRTLRLSGKLAEAMTASLKDNSRGSVTLDAGLR